MMALETGPETAIPIELLVLGLIKSPSMTQFSEYDRHGVKMVIDSGLNRPETSARVL
jgi:hypothetical protein